MPHDSISPIDGRYADKLKELKDYFSEYALIKKRIYIELLYLSELTKSKDLMWIYEKFNQFNLRV